MSPGSIIVPTMNGFGSDLVNKFSPNTYHDSIQNVDGHIVWNRSGFHLLCVLPSRCTFNSSYYRREILEQLSEWQREQAGGAGRKLIVQPTTHGQSTSAHTAAASQGFMKGNGLERVIHPLYSPDLAPSDLYLFSHVKHCLRRQSFETADELFLAIDAVLRGIDQWTMHAAFLDWMQRLRQCVEFNGDPFDGAQKNFVGRISFTR
jgi:hypothetical protein